MRAPYINYVYILRLAPYSRSSILEEGWYDSGACIINVWGCAEIFPKFVHIVCIKMAAMTSHETSSVVDGLPLELRLGSSFNDFKTKLGSSEHNNTDICKIMIFGKKAFFITTFKLSVQIP